MNYATNDSPGPRLVGLVICTSLTIAACGGPGNAVTTAPPTTTASSPSTTMAATTTTAAATTTTEAPITTTTTAKLFGSARFAVSFVMDPLNESDGKPIRASTNNDQTVDFLGGTNEWLTFSRGAITHSAEGWVAKASERSGVTVGEPLAVSIGGADGTAVDLAVGADAFPWIVDANFGASPGDSFRAYSLDVEGIAITIFVLASAEDFEAWIARIEPVLADLRWGESP